MANFYPGIRSNVSEKRHSLQLGDTFGHDKDIEWCYDSATDRIETKSE